MVGSCRRLLETSLNPCGIQEGTQLKLTESPAGTESNGGRLAFAQILHAITHLIVHAKGDNAELFQRFTITVKQVYTHWQLGFGVNPDDIAVARSVTGNNADHLTQSVRNAAYALLK